MPENKKKYTGAWCPSITPFDADGKLDLAALEKHFSRLSEAGTDGVLLMGSIGEFTALSMDERVSLIHAARTMTHLPLIANALALVAAVHEVHDEHFERPQNGYRIQIVDRALVSAVSLCPRAARAGAFAWRAARPRCAAWRRSG